MAQPQDLMSLGENPYLAARVATTLAIVSALNSVNTTATPSAAQINGATQIGGGQFFSYVNTALNSGGLVLPPIGGPNGCLIGDDFIVHNASTNTVYVWAPAAFTGAVGSYGTMNISGINAANSTQVGPNKTTTFYSVANTGTGASNTALYAGIASA